MKKPEAAWPPEKIIEAWANHAAGKDSYDHPKARGGPHCDFDAQAHYWLCQTPGYIGIRHFLVWLKLDGGTLDGAGEFNPKRYDRRWAIGDPRPFGCGDIWHREAEWGSVCRTAFRLFMNAVNARHAQSPFVPIYPVEPEDPDDIAARDSEEIRRKSRYGT